jgi:hypothetical protein
MRLPQLATTTWLQTSSRTVLHLASTRGLLQPFASQFALFSQAKYLHNTTKQSDVAVKSESEDSSPVDPRKLGPKNETHDTKYAKEEPGLANDKEDHTATAKPQYAPGMHPNSVAARARFIEEQRALGWPVAKSHPSIVAGRKRMVEEQRALGFPRLKAGGPARERYLEEQRAIGFPLLKIAVETQRASGYREMRERRRADLLRDIEAANQRKLAEDATFEPPPPLPDLQDRSPFNPRREYPLCPRPGCYARCKNETTMKIHLRKMHDGGYSEETPHKCKLASCNQYYETAQQAQRHFRRVHEGVKAKCPWCDRELSSKEQLKRHLRGVHHQT